MKMLVKAIEDQERVQPGKRILTFKEFCQYVYEPQKRIKSLNLSEEKRLELSLLIQERLNNP